MRKLWPSRKNVFPLDVLNVDVTLTNNLTVHAARQLDQSFASNN